MYVKDGVSYIEIMGKEYVVIGITAMAGESALDDMLFVNIGSLSREEQIQSMFYIDMCDDTDKAYAEMDLLAQSLLGTSLSKREMPTALIDVLAGMYWQRKLEEKAYVLGDGKIPIQRYKDYRNNKIDK